MEIPFCTHSHFSLYQGMRMFRIPESGRLHLELNLSILQKRGIHFYLHTALFDFCICCRGDKLVNINPFLIFCVYVLSQRSKGSSHIWRATGNSKPFLPYRFHMLHVSVLCAKFRNHLKWVYIKVPVSCNIDSCNHSVIQRFLYIVIIRSISCDGCHSLPEHHHTDRCAGFRIVGTVWKIVICSKPLAEAAASDSSCNVHPPCRHVLPKFCCKLP